MKQTRPEQVKSGGKVTTELDRRVVMARYFSAEMLRARRDSQQHV
ncbi:MAG: hypothetical protein OK456_07420 [Thaumarchaeota archaeon]|nr:hypothetical protein [Nitrososphaerota archaeon]